MSGRKKRFIMLWCRLSLQIMIIKAYKVVLFNHLSIVFCAPGDNESGKTTLIAKLQGNEDPKKGSGLEYAYIDVRDEYRDGEYTPKKKKKKYMLPYTQISPVMADRDSNVAKAKLFC